MALFVTFFSELLKLFLHTSWAGEFCVDFSEIWVLLIVWAYLPDPSLHWRFDVWSFVSTECSQELVSQTLCCGASARQLLCSWCCSPLLHLLCFPSFSIWPFYSPLLLQFTWNLLLHAVLRSHLLVSLMTLLMYRTFCVQPSYPLCYPNLLLFTWLLSQTLFPLLFCLNPYSQTIFP